MKKLFFFATAAVVLASCNNDVTISENTALAGSNAQKEIAFTPYAQMPKRAAGAAEYNAVENAAFPQNYEMKVVAYSIPETGTKGNYFGSATANSAPLFAYISAGTGAGYWGGKTTSDKQYWPLAPATLNFLAVTKNGSPDADMGSETFQSDYASGVDVTLGNNIPQAAATGTGQHDLMYALGTASVTQAGNVLTFPDKVDMTFNHALAWVYFRVKAGDVASEAISIKDIKLKNAYYGGTFQARVDNYNVTSPALAFNSSNTKWTAAANQGAEVTSPNFSGSYDVDGTGAGGAANSKSLTSSFENVGDGILVVPTSEITPATNSIASFDIEYYLNGNLYTYNYTPAVLTYEKGKKYIYDITMTLHEIFVNASVEEWKDGGIEYVDIPIFAAGTTGRVFDIPATAGTYTFRVAGFEGDANPAVSGTLSTVITGATATITAYADGVATVKVVVPANTTGSAKNGGTIILTDTGAGADAANNTTVTVNQAN